MSTNKVTTGTSHSDSLSAAEEASLATRKIFHVISQTHGTFPDRSNGVHVVLDCLYRRQVEAGMQPRLIIVSRPNLKFVKSYKETSVLLVSEIVYRLSSKLNVRGIYLYWPFSFSRILRKMPKGAVIHFHGGMNTAFLLMSLQCRLAKRRWIISTQGMHAHLAASNQRNSVGWLYAKYLERFFLTGASVVHCLSSNEVEIIRRIAPRANTRIFQNVFEPDPEARNIRSQARNAEQTVFGCCSRILNKHKGVDLLVRGFAEYLKRGNLGTLELIGNGEDRANIERLARDLGISNRLIMHGALYGEAKLKVMANWDYFALTSHFEGLPTAAIEALYIGIPTIVSSGTNIHDYVATYRAGYVVHPNNPENICLALEAASRASPEERADFRANTQKLTEQQFSPEASLNYLTEIYRKL